jgi:CheY-like chemotaxis protein
MAAPSRVHQIVNNLLTNAFKHTPPGGHIQVKLTNERDTLQISVRDTGCGIDPEHLQRIFRPFEQGERKGTAPQEGLGLGLAIAESLARLHHGKLRAESAGRGRGSKFTLTLPLSNSFPTMAGAQMDGQIAPASNTCLRLLLVDDHLDTLEIVARLLRRSGYTVEMAQNLAEAETFLGRTDVLISDIGLPDGSGLDLMARFKSSGGLGGIAISGFGQSHDLERSRQAGFSHHLVKPLDLEALRRALASFTVKT